MNDTNLTDIIEIKPPLELDPGDGSGWAVWVLIGLFLAGAALLFWALRTPHLQALLDLPRGADCVAGFTSSVLSSIWPGLGLDTVAQSS